VHFRREPNKSEWNSRKRLARGLDRVKTMQCYQHQHCSRCIQFPKPEREREPTVTRVLLREHRATFLADACRITTGRAFGKQGGRFEHLDLAYREVWLFKSRHEATGTGDSDYLAQVRSQIDTGGG